MPVHTGKDSKGCYAQWGGHGHKYYYTCGDSSAMKNAKAKAAKQGAAAHAHGYVGNKLHYVTTNIKPIVRNDTMEGREWTVVPTQMITEGVHNGSDGPIFYPAEELAKIPTVWNHKPVVVYHPVVNGRSVSACDPDQITARKVGVLMNTKWDDGTKKLGTETWLDPVRVQTVDNRVAEAIKESTMMEVSTGLFMDLERVEGEWNGEEYIGVAHNLQPDHLALLPDVKGACSIEDGAGFLRTNEESRKLMINEMSHDSLRALLNSAIRSLKENAWIEDVFDGFFIYEENGKMYKQTYAKNDNGVSLAGLPKLVERQVTYKEVSVLNDDGSVKKGINMNKKKIVDLLIANEQTSWTEDDRDSLMALEEKMLTQMSELFKEEEPSDNKKDDDKKDDATANENKKDSQTPTANAQTPPKPQTVQEYINNAPPKIKEMLEEGMATLDTEKTSLVKKIMDNENNTFTKEHLESLHINMLRAIAKMAAPPTDNKKEDNHPLYFGNNNDPTDNSDNLPEPLPLPAMNFEKVA